MVSLRILGVLVLLTVAAVLTEAKKEKKKEHPPANAARLAHVNNGHSNDGKKAGKSRPGTGNRPTPPKPHGGHGRRQAPCLQYGIVDGVNTTTYDQPCAFPDLFDCRLPAHPESSDRTTYFCEAHQCTTDDDCQGENTCRHGRNNDQEQGRCSVPRGYQQYAAACAVYDANRALVRSRDCLRANHVCSTNNRVITLEGAQYFLHHCRPQDANTIDRSADDKPE